MHHTRHKELVDEDAPVELEMRAAVPDSTSRVGANGNNGGACIRRMGQRRGWERWCDGVNVGIQVSGSDDL